MLIAGNTVASILTSIRADMFVFHAFCLFAIISFRYLVTAGLAWWVIRGRSIEFDHDDVHDLRLSVVSAVIFALALATAVQLHSCGLTRIYDRVSTYGWWYIGASYLIVLVLQDGYFYATHRLFHLPRFYRLTHQGHHRSRRPSPWTSFAFDPIESLAHAGFLVAIACIVPLHLGTILAVLTTMTIWAVVNHLGLEHLPLRFPHHWLGRWMIGPAHHSIHHIHQDKHYGLYFTFWDRVMGTESRGYNDRLRKIWASIQSCYSVDNQ
jgi:Delta7-sterol 5-desaturase